MKNKRKSKKITTTFALIASVCGILFTLNGCVEKAPAGCAHEWGDPVKVVAANCEEDGLESYICSKCEEKKTEIVKALGHNTQQKSGKAATCTESGYNAYEVCIREGCAYTTFEAIPATGHISVKLAGTDPKCSKTGSKDGEICIYCSTVTKEPVEIPALGHDWVTVPGEAATCTEAGYTDEVKCKRCYIRAVTSEEIEATGHDLKRIAAKAPTCVEVGWAEYEECQRLGCNYTTYMEIKATGHDYENGICSVCDYVLVSEHTCIYELESVTKAATCTVDGIKTKTCLCGKTTTESIPATGHSYDSGEVTTSAGCETAGNKVYTCNGCGATYNEAIAATGHSYDSGEVTTSAGCETAGVKTYTCANCNKTRTESIAATGHSYDTGTVTTAATCTTNGEKTYACEKCSNTKTERIAATGHEYNSGECSKCGQALTTTAFTVRNGASLEIESERPGLIWKGDISETALSDLIDSGKTLQYVSVAYSDFMKIDKENEDWITALDRIGADYKIQTLGLYEDTTTYNLSYHDIAYKNVNTAYTVFLMEEENGAVDTRTYSELNENAVRSVKQLTLAMLNVNAFGGNFDDATMSSLNKYLDECVDLANGLSSPVYDGSTISITSVASSVSGNAGTTKEVDVTLSSGDSNDLQYVEVMSSASNKVTASINAGKLVLELKSAGTATIKLYLAGVVTEISVTVS